MTFPGASFAFEVRAQVGPPEETGSATRGRSRIIPILSGSFEGPRIKGRVLPGGADSQIVHPDGLIELDARYTLETGEGQLIHVRNRGLRHPAAESVPPDEVYFRTVPVFETSAPELEWLTRFIFIGSGERYPSDVVIRFWRLD